MSFALEESEPFPVAVRRIAVEQIDLALGHLGAAYADLNESAHATRQCLKRLRALVALARAELGDCVVEREWNCYRSVGRLLADGRDAAVTVETFDVIIEWFSDELDREAFIAKRCFLEHRRDARLRLMVAEGALQKATNLLIAARGRVAGWPLKQEGFKALREGLQRSYRAGRQGLRSVIGHPSPFNFHEWRRPVKLLWHQLQILAPLWPVVLNAHGDQLRHLSDCLNENHDLDALRQPALWFGFDLQSQDRQALVALVERRCRVLEGEALPLGARLYAERPRAFSERMGRYWRARESANSNDPLISDTAVEIVLAVSA